VLKGVLRDHLRLDAKTLDTTVFPDSASAKALTGLMRMA
jgi:uncharacterized protein (DUF1501 family)